MPDADIPTAPLCAGTLLASTMALMTMWAAPCPRCSADAGIDAMRAELAGRIVRHLALLQTHPDVGPGLRNTAAQLGAQWQALSDSGSAAADVTTLVNAPRSAALH